MVNTQGHNGYQPLWLRLAIAILSFSMLACVCESCEQGKIVTQPVVVPGSESGGNILATPQLPPREVVVSVDSTVRWVVVDSNGNRVDNKAYLTKEEADDVAFASNEGGIVIQVADGNPTGERGQTYDPWDPTAEGLPPDWNPRQVYYRWRDKVYDTLGLAKQDAEASYEGGQIVEKRRGKEIKVEATYDPWDPASEGLPADHPPTQSYWEVVNEYGRQIKASFQDAYDIASSSWSEANIREMRRGEYVPNEKGEYPVQHLPAQQPPPGLENQQANQPYFEWNGNFYPTIEEAQKAAGLVSQYVKGDEIKEMVRGQAKNVIQKSVGERIGVWSGSCLAVALLLAFFAWLLHSWRRRKKKKKPKYVVARRKAPKKKKKPKYVVARRKAPKEKVTVDWRPWERQRVILPILRGTWKLMKRITEYAISGSLIIGWLYLFSYDTYLALVILVVIAGILIFYTLFLNKEIASEKKDKIHLKKRK